MADPFHSIKCPPDCTNRRKCIQRRYRSSDNGKKIGREAAKRQAQEFRQEVINFLGGKCARCDWTDIRALQIDHVNGGGGKERKKLGNRGLLRRVLKHPTDYQLLCANHNWIKRAELGETVRFNPATQ